MRNFRGLCSEMGPLLAISFILITILVSSVALTNPSARIRNAYAQAQPTLSAPINLSNDTGNDTNPDIWNVGTHLYVAWAEGNAGLMFRESPDGGMSWYPPLNSSALNIAPPGKTSAPLLSANGSNVYVVWSQIVGTTGTQIDIATSTNYGQSFSPVVQITNGSLGYITPVIASWGSLVAVGYAGNGETYLVTSQNNGTTWTSPLQISTNHEPQLAIWGNNIYAVADPLFFAVSNNGGQTWRVSSIGPTGSEGFLAAYGSNVYATWETKNASSQAYVLVSNNYGVNYTISLLSSTLQNSWAPMIWAYGSSAWIALHTFPGGNDSEVYVYTTLNNGSTWSSPVQLSTALSNSSDTGFPFTVMSSNGHDVFVGWSQMLNPTTWSLMVSYSNDGGSTWIPPPGVNVSQNPNGTSGSDNSDLADGAITSYGSTCFAVWQLINSTSNEIYFSVLSYPETITTTSSTISSTAISDSSTSQTDSVSTLSSSSSTTSQTQSTTNPGINFGNSFLGIPASVLEATIIGGAIGAAIVGIGALVYTRKK